MPISHRKSPSPPDKKWLHSDSKAYDGFRTPRKHVYLPFAPSRFGHDTINKVEKMWLFHRNS